MARWFLRPVYSRFDTLWICVAAFAFADLRIALGVITVLVGVTISAALTVAFLKEPTKPKATPVATQDSSLPGAPPSHWPTSHYGCEQPCHCWLYQSALQTSIRRNKGGA